MTAHHALRIVVLVVIMTGCKKEPARVKQDELAARIEAAPLPDRPRLAEEAVAQLGPERLFVLAQTNSVELAVAATDRLEALRGPEAALAGRAHVVTLDASVAEHWDALGRARIANGKLDDALAAWDRAIAIAPAQPAFRLAPIQALVIAGKPERAKQRAKELAEQARAKQDVELLVTASHGAAAAGDAALGVELAQAAHTLRASDGRLAFLVAQRLADAGQTQQAIDAYTTLLACGAHGRPWHRHEVAGKLLALAQSNADTRAAVIAALDAKRACETVDAADLAPYVAGLKK